MPSVNSSKLARAKSGTNWLEWNVVRGKTVSGWQIGKKVWSKVNGVWTEVWNARPVVTSNSFTTTTTTMTFNGQVDPNNFTSTVSFRYREVGAGSWSNSGTTTKSGDTLQSYSVTATIADAYKNWESQAVGTNDGGTADTPSTIYLDCRKHDASGSGWSTSDSSNSSTCAGCGTVTTRTYTKTGCPTYTGVVGTCGTWTDYFDFVTVAVSGGTYSYVTGSIWGWYYSDSAGNASATCSGGSGLVGPGNVQSCSVGGYRVTGTDTCVIVSCC